MEHIVCIVIKLQNLTFFQILICTSKYFSFLLFMSIIVSILFFNLFLLRLYGILIFLLLVVTLTITDPSLFLFIDILEIIFPLTIWLCLRLIRILLLILHLVGLLVKDNLFVLTSLSTLFHYFRIWCYLFVLSIHFVVVLNNYYINNQLIIKKLIIL